MPKLSQTVSSYSAGSVSSARRSPNTADDSVHRGLPELLHKNDLTSIMGYNGE